MDRILKILKKENGPRASSAPALELNTIIFKHVYWYMQLISGERLQDHWSSCLDILLKPLCQEVSSFVRDDIDFLNHLPSEVKPNSKLITFDVVNLYTNIPHDLGITAINYWLD